MDIIRKHLTKTDIDKDKHIYNSNLYRYGMKHKIHSDDLTDSFNHYYQIKDGMTVKDINIKYNIYNYMEDYLIDINTKNNIWLKLLNYIGFIITLMFTVVVFISTIYNYINANTSDIILKITMALVIARVLIREIRKVIVRKKSYNLSFSKEDRKDNLNIEGYLKRPIYNADELISLLSKSALGKYVLKRLYIDASKENNKNQQKLNKVSKLISYIMVVIIIQSLYFPNLISKTPLYALITGLIISMKYLINTIQGITQYILKKKADKIVYSKGGM